MRAHLSNAAYGVLDYAAYPIAMLVSAPALLKYLGVAQYGIWIVTTAALNTGAIIASGFGDANIQYIASARSQGNADLLVRAVRSMLGINLLLGVVLAVISWMLAPLAVTHLVGPAAVSAYEQHFQESAAERQISPLRFARVIVNVTGSSGTMTGAPCSPEFPVELVGAGYFMRLSPQKAAHVVVGWAAYGKFGSHQRTWVEYEFFECSHSISKSNRWASPVFFGPRTLVRTWGTRHDSAWSGSVHSAPTATRGLREACLFGLRIASILMLVRAIESVCVSTQRAFERYGEAIRISLLARIISVAAAVLLSLHGFGVAAIMAATACFMVLGTVAQFVRMRQFLGAASLWPSFDRHATSALFGFGAFSWLLAVASVLFTQADRLLLGVSLGASAVTAYALCVQMAQPIYGIASSGLHFLFPYLAARKSTAMKQPILLAFTVNVMIVGAGTALLLLFGHAALHAWVGPSVAQSAVGILAPIVWSFALLGLSVTGYYSLLALGHVHIVTALNLTGGLAMLLLMAWLLPVWGVHGIAIARLVYGATAVLMYVPLARVLGGARAPSLSPVCEDV